MAATHFTRSYRSIIASVVGAAAKTKNIRPGLAVDAAVVELVVEVVVPLDVFVPLKERKGQINSNQVYKLQVHHIFSFGVDRRKYETLHFINKPVNWRIQQKDLSNLLLDKTLLASRSQSSCNEACLVDCSRTPKKDCQHSSWPMADLPSENATEISWARTVTWCHNLQEGHRSCLAA